MDIIEIDDLRQLGETRDAACVSFYMPTRRVESEMAQNPIRLKNLLREARRKLSEAGVRQQEAESLLLPISELLHNESYWLRMNDGLAGFVAPNTARFFRLPSTVEEMVHVGDRFHIKPLFPMTTGNERFYVLALAQGSVRLLEGARFSVTEIESTAFPEDIFEAVLKYKETQASLQWHTGGTFQVRGGRQDQVVHGQGRQTEDLQSPHSELREFFSLIDDGIRKTIGADNAPMVLAGVEYYLPVYRAVNSYPGLIEEKIIAGNPEFVADRELHDRAWEIVEPVFSRRQQEAVERFQTLFHTKSGLASDEVKEIIPAAVFSRIETLFVCNGAHLWGAYDPDSNKVSLQQDGAGAEDLLDLAALHTFLNGGSVHVLDREDMPVEKDMAAIFRFPADMKAS